MTSPHQLPGAPGRDAATGAPGSIPQETVPDATVSEPVLPDAEHPAMVLRPALPDDVPEILAMVRELAEYERSAHKVVATDELVAGLLFGDNTPAGAPAAFCHVIETAPGADPGAGEDTCLVALALWFLNTSTWTGQHGIYLEDLYVRPQHRGLGVGRMLMSELARICTDRGYIRLEWSVLDWNEPAIEFYRGLGAQAMDEWTVHRLAGPALATLAQDAPGPRRARDRSAAVRPRHRIT